MGIITTFFKNPTPERLSPPPGLTRYRALGGSRWRVGKNAFKIPIRYVRQDERNWTYAAFHSLEEVVTLSTLGCQLVLKDIYAKVDVSQPSGTV